MITDGIKKKLGFGLMRLPTTAGGKIDNKQLCAMVDEFIASGFNYFDTAHGYMDTLSEVAVRDCLTSRYPRDKYILTDKLTDVYFKKQADIRPFFEQQLKTCGVDYFDFYLMHAQNKTNYEQFKRCNAYATALEFKKEGKIKHLGISFHDSADVLDKMLTENPEVEVVQLQFNYVDYNDPAVQSRACYDVCVKHGKPVIVMEPVKGGNLVKLPDAARAHFDALGGGSYASYAIRFAAGFDNIMTVLSGMSTIEQLRDNVSYMKDFVPLNVQEKRAVDSVVAVFNGMNLIPCTACRYCTAGCPKSISIPDLFALMNTKKIYNDWNADYYYDSVYAVNGGKASACISCGKCESACPQHLKIRELLKSVAKEFEK